MRFEVEVDETGQITLKRDNEVVLISKYMSRVCDIIMDMYDNDGESELLKAKEPNPDLLNIFKF